MSALREILSVVNLCLRGIPARLRITVVIVVGVAAVVAVFVTALAVAAGFSRAAASSGDAGRAVVLGAGATTEAGSTLSREDVIAVTNAAGLRAGADGAVIASADALAFLALTDPTRGINAFVTLRGVGAQAARLRPAVRVIGGTTFASGAHEVIVGRAVQRRLGGLAVGSTVPLPNGEWRIVGVFETGGDTRESELMTDAETLLNAYQRNGYNSVTVALDGEDGFERFSAAIAADPSLSVNVLREEAYFATALRDVSWLLTVIAYGIGAIMALGAALGALNTMYSAIDARGREIVTLRAIGFGTAPVVVSVMAEALLLALVGAALGAAVSWAFFNGSTVSTMTGITPSQLTFALAIGPRLVLSGMLLGCAIALLGGLFAAVRAARFTPLAAATRLA